MSIFGDLDAAQIPTNPFFVEAGEYSAEVTAAEYKTNRDGQRQLHIQYTITDEESTFKDSKLNHYFNLVDADMTLEKLILLPAAEQQKIRQSNASLKKTLCGSDGNEKFRGLGVAVDDLNSKDWDPAVLKGTVIRVGVSNFGDSGVNIKWVNLPEED